MQRYPFAMATYVIGIIPLIKRLKAEFPDIPYTWYAYNICALGMFAKIDLYFNPQKILDPGQGYYPKPSKIVIILHLGITEAANRFGLSHSFKIFTSTCYLCDFIGDDNSKCDWL